MGKYRVEFDRNGCIGDFACVGVSPDQWETREDGKVSIIGGEKVPNSDNEQKVIGDSEYQNHVLAAAVCPVKVIKIRNLETNELVEI